MRGRLIHDLGDVIEMTNDKVLMFCTTLIASKSVSRCYTSSFMPLKDAPKLAYMKKRGVSDIIATLLLLGITVAGAVLVSSFLYNSNLLQPQSNPSSQTASIKITGYDTRDGTNLSVITGFNNFLDASPRLCTTSCNISPNNTPSAGGTEFIILTIRNTGPNQVHVQSVEINNVEHMWSSATGGQALTMTAPPSYPPSGQFSIIPTSNTAPITQMSDNKLNSNDEVRLVIKLSETISYDIGINEPIKVRFFTDLNDSPAITITSGGVT